MKLYWILIPGSWLLAQQPLLPAREVNELCTRSIQLMEAGGVAVPDLKNSSSPLIANAKQSCAEVANRANFGPATYNVLTNLKAYIALSDAVPKPFPFPDAARAQFAELRDNTVKLESHFRALIDSKETQIRSSDRDNLQRYAEMNRRLPAPNTKNARVVFLGDSITDFWRLNEYFPDRDFVNRGISGQITGQMLARFKADVIDLHPEAVLILGGTNDLARGIPLVAIENNYLMMADLADRYKIKVIFATVLPVSDYHKDTNPALEMTRDRPPAYISALNEWLGALCQQRGYTFLNYFQSMVDSAGRLQADLSDDGLHPNPKGYRIMAPLALEAIQKTLAPPKPVAAPVPTKPAKRKTTSN
jgi:lysophospholipase L1-like esterase